MNKWSTFETRYTPGRQATSLIKKALVIGYTTDMLCPRGNGHTTLQGARRRRGLYTVQTVNMNVTMNER